MILLRQKELGVLKKGAGAKSCGRCRTTRNILKFPSQKNLTKKETKQHRGRKGYMGNQERRGKLTDGKAIQEKKKRGGQPPKFIFHLARQRASSRKARSSVPLKIGKYPYGPRKGGVGGKHQKGDR